MFLRVEHVYVHMSLSLAAVQATVSETARVREVHFHFMRLQHVSKRPGGGNVAVGKIKSLLQFLSPHWSFVL